VRVILRYEFRPPDRMPIEFIGKQRKTTMSDKKKRIEDCPKCGAVYGITAGFGVDRPLGWKSDGDAWAVCCPCGHQGPVPLLPEIRDDLSRHERSLTFQQAAILVWNHDAGQGDEPT
jgi:hypothetical protein